MDTSDILFIWEARSQGWSTWWTNGGIITRTSAAARDRPLRSRRLGRRETPAGDPGLDRYKRRRCVPRPRLCAIGRRRTPSLAEGADESVLPTAARRARVRRVCELFFNYEDGEEEADLWRRRRGESPPTTPSRTPNPPTRTASYPSSWAGSRSPCPASLGRTSSWRVDGPSQRGRRYQRLMRMHGVDLEFTDGALRVIARAALRRETGARGLRTLVERLLTEAMFEVPDAPDVVKVVVDESSARRGLGLSLFAADDEQKTVGADGEEEGGGGREAGVPRQGRSRGGGTGGDGRGG